MSDDLSRATLVLIGAGRAGRAFARSWSGAGGSLLLVSRQIQTARQAARDTGATGALALDGRSPLVGDLLVLAVPDDRIATMARTLAATARFRFAFHVSGALTSEALAPLRAGGAALGSLHPLRAFSGTPEENWRDAFVAVEGEEPAVETAVRMCRRIGAQPRRLAGGGKPLYHAAATLAAGGSASLLSFAARLWSEAGLDEEEGRAALSGLAATAIDAVGKWPFDRALTGPVARRDVETIRLHRGVLVGRPDIARLYALLAGETLRRTPGRGREQEIAALLGIEGEGLGSSEDRAAKESDKTGRNG